MRIQATWWGLLALALGGCIWDQGEGTGDVGLLEARKTTIAVNEEIEVTAKSASGHLIVLTDIVWSSSDAERATVDDWGRVRGTGAGDVTITARANGAEASIALTVKGAIHQGRVEKREEVWRERDNPHRIVGDGVIFGGASLVIEAGVEVFFEHGTHLLMGDGANAAALVINGTAAKPVLFTSAESVPAPGDYGGLFVTEIAKATIDHLTVEFAGGEARTGEHGSLQFRGEFNDSTLRNVTVRDGGGDGIRMLFGASFSSESSQITVERNAGYGVYFEDVNSVGSLPQTIAFESNGRTGIFVAGGTVEETQTWTDRGMPYVIDGGASIDVRGANEPVLTLDAGVELQFGKDGGFLIGEAEPGALRLLGTADRPVVLTSAAATRKAGDWFGIIFADLATTESKVDRARIEYAGGESPSNVEDALIVVLNDTRGAFITNSEFRNSAGHGVSQFCMEIEPLRCTWTHFDAPVHGNSFTNIAGKPVHFE